MKRKRDEDASGAHRLFTSVPPCNRACLDVHGPAHQRLGGRDQQGGSARVCLGRDDRIHAAVHVPAAERVIGRQGQCTLTRQMAQMQTSKDIILASWHARGPRGLAINWSTI